jgi:PAS domain S-box-containing protein
MEPAHSAQIKDVEPLELFQALVQQAPDAMVYADCTGKIRVWNRAAETLFGFSTAEVLGESLEIIIPARFRNAHWSGFSRAMETGSTKYGGRVLTTRSIHKNGEKLYVDLSFSMIKNSANLVIGALAIGRRSTRAEEVGNCMNGKDAR